MIIWLYEYVIGLKDLVLCILDYSFINCICLKFNFYGF